MITVTFLPKGVTVEVEEGTSLLSAQIRAGLQPDAPCGGRGRCGKCRVQVGGAWVPACQTPADRDMTVLLPERGREVILEEGIRTSAVPDGTDAYAAAFDVGTTTLVGYLMDGKTGELLASAGGLNPQTRYGADVISRIQAVLERRQVPMRGCVLQALGDLTRALATKAGIRCEDISVAAIVGNTSMHHLLLGIDPSSLITPPYMPAVTEALELPAGELLPIGGKLRILPNIAGFVGADTVACMVAARFSRREELTLMIDIGTNGEMVLGSNAGWAACSTAAGPAFEGARISRGMRGCPGAVDRVWLEDGQPRYHVIGEETAVGLCGSGLLDLVACLLETGAIDGSGRLAGKAFLLPGTDIVLTQADVREVQLAKAAIRAGIEILCGHLNAAPEDIRHVLLAGAFGNYLDPSSACRIGMIPPCLLDRIQPIGNAAGTGARLCALSRSEFVYSQALAKETGFLELASLPDFQERFVDAMGFPGEDSDDI